MKKLIREYLWSFYLGGAVSVLGYPFYTWEFYAITVPTIFLVALKEAKDDKG